MAENEPKKETVRITLPTRPAVGEGGSSAPIKKETVRINLPSRPALGSAPVMPVGTPKKESAKLSNLAKPPVLPPKPMAPPPPGAVPRPPAPAAGAPPAAPGSVPSAPRPLAPVGGPPRPPGAPGAPIVPRPPGAPAGPGAPKPPGAPGSITRPLAPLPGPPKPPGIPVPAASTAETAVPSVAAVPLAKNPVSAVSEDSAATVVSPTPKKDTVRIEVPRKAVTPQNTVKMQTQPLMPRPPAAEVRALPVSSSVVAPVETTDDPTLAYASYGVLAFSVLVLIFQVLNYIALNAN